MSLEVYILIWYYLTDINIPDLEGTAAESILWCHVLNFLWHKTVFNRLKSFLRIECLKNVSIHSVSRRMGCAIASKISLNMKIAIDYFIFIILMRNKENCTHFFIKARPWLFIIMVGRIKFILKMIIYYHLADCPERSFFSSNK